MFEKEAEKYAVKSYGNDAFTQVNMPQMIEPVRMNLKQGFRDGAESREKRIAELQEENTELKHTIAELRRDKDNLNTHTKAQEKLSEYRSDQLTKAKEIISKLLSRLNRLTYTGLNCEECKEAEQFLKDNA